MQAGLGERRELSRRGDTRRTGFLSLKKRDLVRFITLKKRKNFKLKFDNIYGRDHQKRLIEAKIEDPKVSRIDKPMYDLCKERQKNSHKERGKRSVKKGNF